MSKLNILQVEVEVNRNCNLSCSYCPVSLFPPGKEVYMPYSLFDHILSELQQIDFGGVFTFHRYNEPTLRKDLETLVEMTKLKLPMAKVVLYSNGLLLNNERIKSLFNAGLDHIIITDHARIGHISTDNILVKQPEDLLISTRAGWLGSVKEPMRLPCFAPSEMLIVGYNGDVYFCTQDYGRKHVLGNLNEQNLVAIWNNPDVIRMRELLKLGKGRKHVIYVLSAMAQNIQQRGFCEE